MERCPLSRHGIDNLMSSGIASSRRAVGLALATLAFVSCGGPISAPPAEGVKGKVLVDPAKDGEAVLANLPEVDPPLGAGEPRMVGSQDMSIEEFVQTIGSELNGLWRSKFEGSRYAYTDAKFVVLRDKPIPIAGCTGFAAPDRRPFFCAKTSSVYYPLPWVSLRGQETPSQVGDFAVAVILAHEEGHHVQALLGILGDPHLYTIQRELQADCLAGIWGRSAYQQGSLERGDVEEAIQVLQYMADLPGTPYTDPTAHGSERQRVDAFMLGFKSGDAGECQF
jgi:predicted metalloprotease